MTSWWRNRRCPHMNIQGIYGDNIHAHGGKRLYCGDCGRLLDGPVSLARDTMRVEEDWRLVSTDHNGGLYEKERWTRLVSEWTKDE